MSDGTGNNNANNFYSPKFKYTISSGGSADYQGFSVFQNGIQTAMCAADGNQDMGCKPGQAAYGLFADQQQYYQFRDVVDGLSNTMVLVENGGRNDLWVKGTQVKAYPPPYNYTNSSSFRPITVAGGPTSITMTNGCRVLTKTERRAVQSIVVIINCTNQNNVNFYSFHPGGINISADGRWFGSVSKPEHEFGDDPASGDICGKHADRRFLTLFFRAAVKLAAALSNRCGVCPGENCFMHDAVAVAARSGGVALSACPDTTICQPNPRTERTGGEDFRACKFVRLWRNG